MSHVCLVILERRELSELAYQGPPKVQGEGDAHTPLPKPRISRGPEPHNVSAQTAVQAVGKGEASGPYQALNGLSKKEVQFLFCSSKWPKMRSSVGILSLFTFASSGVGWGRAFPGGEDFVPEGHYQQSLAKQPRRLRT